MPRLTVRNAVWTALVILVFAPGAAWAQGARDGAIAGAVTDATGGVLPGVTIEAASPALIEGSRVAVTDGQGLYRIVGLRPGAYSVTFTLPGFATVVREGIKLNVGFTAKRECRADHRVGRRDDYGDRCESNRGHSERAHPERAHARGVGCGSDLQELSIPCRPHRRRVHAHSREPSGCRRH